MKIAVLGSLWLSMPPKRYGGTEQVIYDLVNGLTERGHQVTLFAPESTKVKAKVVPVMQKPILDSGINWTSVEAIHFHLLSITQVFEAASEFDLIHVHLNKSHDYFALPLASFSKTPVLSTFHFALPTPSWNRVRHQVLNRYKMLPFTSISNAQRKGSDFNFIKTIYNGLKLGDYPFSEKADDYFTWLGKINPLKGTKEAILAAKKAKVKLCVMGAVEKNVPELFTYFKKEVEPLFDQKQIVWLGEVDLEQKVKYLKNAKALLNPIKWNEPFGLVMAEAQAVGTPVIAYNKGSVPEVVRDNVTGFVVDTEEKLIASMQKIDTLKREACRRNVEKNFSLDKMLDGYEEAYEKVRKNWQTYQKKQQKYLLETNQYLSDKKKVNH